MIMILIHICDDSNLQTASHDNSSRKQKTQRASPTHLVPDILVGAGIQQHPHAGHATLRSGTNQRRGSELRARVCANGQPPFNATHKHNAKRYKATQIKIKNNERLEKEVRHFK
jgi:hypothetical protein